MKFCDVAGCGEPLEARGMCSKHYMRLLRNGSLKRKRIPGLTTAERFWQYVEKGPDCWRWTGGISHTYGNFYVNIGPNRYRQVPAHRFAYELMVGSIPDGLTLDHMCHTPECRKPAEECPHRRCVNPAHLKPKTLPDNIKRTGNGAKTHCKRGHEFTAANTYVMANGGRSCRQCQVLHDANRRERDRAKK
jgi:hypothetical protein